METKLKRRPSRLDRGLHRPVAVELSLGPRADLAGALTRIGEVLSSDNEFCELKTLASGRRKLLLGESRTTSMFELVGERSDEPVERRPAVLRVAQPWPMYSTAASGPGATS